LTPQISETELMIRTQAWIKQNSRAAQEMAGSIAPDTDLIANGLLDSFGFIELIVFVEGQTGSKVDFSGADLTDFTTVVGLCRHLLGSTAVRV